MTKSLLALTLALSCVATAAHATGFETLAIGKMARLENTGDPTRNSAIFTIGRDPALQNITAPGCPTVTKVEVIAYLQSTYRDAVLAAVTLDCSKWTLSRGVYRYSDPTGTVRSIRYGKNGLRVVVAGPGYTPIGGPVGFVQIDVEIGTRLLRSRFHNFSHNDGQLVRSRKASTPGALGEKGFWDVITNDLNTEEHEVETIAHLEKAVRRDAADGRSRFLLGMIHLYRGGQRLTSYASVDAETVAELQAAKDWFDLATPLLWNDATLTGDSRVPGFAGAARYTLGYVLNDAQLKADGLAQLEHAAAINQFFNVFDLIPVLQALPPSDPVFQSTFAIVQAYLSDPATIACVNTQPELCANEGMASRNIQGSLLLFGDLYAKAGNLQQANFWYTLVNIATTSWEFLPLIQDRTTNAAARVALYQDADPSNDPPVIGLGPEACAMCHHR